MAAARAVFVEQGADAALEAVAQRAGVGIATLYRRFGDRDALVREVAVDGFRDVEAAARAAAGEGPAALAVFLRAFVGLRLGLLAPVLFPLVEGRLRTDPALADATQRMSRAMQELVAAAQAGGTLRPDVAADDVLLLLALLTRPLPGIPGVYFEQVTPRLLHLLLEGLQPAAEHTPAPAQPPRPQHWPQPQTSADP